MDIILKKQITDKNGTEHNFAKVRGLFGKAWAFLDDDGDFMFPLHVTEKSILNEIDIIANG